MRSRSWAAADAKDGVHGLEMFRKLLDEGQRGQRRILLRGTKREKWSAASAGQARLDHPACEVRVRVYVLSKEEAQTYPFFNNYRPQFYFRTTDVTGSVELRRHRDGDAGDNVKMVVTLITPIAMEQGCALPSRGGKTVAPASCENH